MPKEQRLRADGTWTYTSPEWDAAWYWPVGTAVLHCHAPATVTKANAVSVSLRFADGRELHRVPFKALTRREGA